MFNFIPSSLGTDFRKLSNNEEHKVKVSAASALMPLNSVLTAMRVMLRPMVLKVALLTLIDIQYSISISKPLLLIKVRAAGRIDRGRPRVGVEAAY